MVGTRLTRDSLRARDAVPASVGVDGISAVLRTRQRPPPLRLRPSLHRRPEGEAAHSSVRGRRTRAARGRRAALTGRTARVGGRRGVGERGRGGDPSDVRQGRDAEHVRVPDCAGLLQRGVRAPAQGRPPPPPLPHPDPGWRVAGPEAAPAPLRHLCSDPLRWAPHAPLLRRNILRDLGPHAPSVRLRPRAGASRQRCWRGRNDDGDGRPVQRSVDGRGAGSDDGDVPAGAGGAAGVQPDLRGPQERGRGAGGVEAFLQRGPRRVGRRVCSHPPPPERSVGREHAEPRAGGLRDAAEPRAGPRLRGERLSRRRRRPAPLEPARVQQRRSHRIRRALLDPRARPSVVRDRGEGVEGGGARTLQVRAPGHEPELRALPICISS
mmetsp:Transcript_44261/g.104868  ORF Transcript_44261/g.104868 Transcript_44261/m.104868 type:complete len:381 (+) Transcript_44261:731-1873(+)